MWWYAVVFVAALAVAYSRVPKPQTQRPAGLGDVQAPTAEEGREIPVLFGTKTLKGPNVVWYGDLKAIAIRSKGGKK